MSKIILSEQGSTPSTPSTGKSTFYIGSDGRARLVDDGGNERILEASGLLAGSGLNTNADFTVDVGIGFGLNLSTSGINVDQAVLDTRYRTSGANLEAAGDVARVSTLVSGHTLGWNGTSWVNSNPGAGGGGGGNDTLTINSTDKVEVGIIIFNSGLTGDVSDVTLPSFDTGFHRLEIECWIRSDRAADQEAMGIEFNSDTTDSNYIDLERSQNNSTPSTVSATTRLAFVVPAASAAAGQAGYARIAIFQPSSSSFFKNFKVEYDAPGGTTKSASTRNMTWLNTAAITAIKIINNNSANMISGSLIRMTGYKDVDAVNGTLGDATIVAGLISS